MAARVLLLLVSLLFAAACRANDLVPFIAWSNRDVLSALRTSEEVDEITYPLSLQKTDLTVIFLTKAFSFDDVAKYGGVFGEDSNSDLSSLKAALKQAKSQYWSGVSPPDDRWIFDFSRQVGEKAVFVDPSASFEPKNWQGVVAVDVSVFKDYKDKDAVVKKVMSALAKEDKSFLAIFTQGSNPSEKVVEDGTKLKPRSQRSVEPQIRENNANNVSNSDSDCPIGGSLFEVNETTNVSTTCLLFCLKPVIIFTPDTSSNLSCNLTTPKPISDYACDPPTENPYVTVTYDVMVGGSGNGNNNTCEENETIISNHCLDDGLEYTIEINLKFVFSETSSNTSDYYASYFMTINSTISVHNKDGKCDNTTETAVLERQHPEDLYDNFTVPMGLSYACAASDSPYNTYTSRNASNTSVGTRTSLVLTSIQVQPFNVSDNSFSTAYNCVGYFTIASWMGIVTVAVLLIIFYLSIICAFSMNTIDRFEDPRGQTILVEKLH